VKRRKHKRHTTRACSSGAVRYRDDTEAKRALRGFKTHSTRERVPCRVYKCSDCKGWHLTAQPSKGVEPA
jgi:hypothetical protein